MPPPFAVVRRKTVCWVARNASLGVALKKRYIPSLLDHPAAGSVSHFAPRHEPLVHLPSYNCSSSSNCSSKGSLSSPHINSSRCTGFVVQCAAARQDVSGMRQSHLLSSLRTGRPGLFAQLDNAVLHLQGNSCFLSGAARGMANSRTFFSGNFRRPPKLGSRPTSDGYASLPGFDSSSAAPNFYGSKTGTAERSRNSLRAPVNSSELDDAIAAEATLLQKWNDVGLWTRSIDHFETRHGTLTSTSNLSSVDHRILAEYIRALVNTNQLFKVNTKDRSTARALLSSQYGPGGNESPLEFQLKFDDRSQPLQVAIKNGKATSFVREILKYAITVVVCVSALSIVLEGAVSNLPKGLGLGTKKVNTATSTGTTFDDVKGCDEVKEELQEIVSYLTNPAKFTRLGARLPKGVLLSGPPGTGKTLIARAIAGEANVPFIHASGSEFEEMFVGVGARRIRDLFAAARKLAPAIVFIDEIDAVGARRVNKENTSVRMTLNQLLVELDGFSPNEGIVVICATNFAESLDPALTRPGRLDKTVVVPLPDLQGRTEILNLYGRKVVLDDDVDLSILARRTAGMSGADLFNVINIAAVRSSVLEETAISMAALEAAFDRVVVGLERRNPMSEEEKYKTAIHEAGHTLVSWYTKGTDLVHKATIMPRGSALGITWQIPLAERYQQSLFELEAKLDVLMGGKAAETLKFGTCNVTAGCSSDIRTATNIARQMVMQFGMGVDDTSVPMFIDPQTYGSLSNDLRQRVDKAVQKLLDEAYGRARSLLKDNLPKLESVADALVEFETLGNNEIQLVIDGQKDHIPVLRDQAKKTSIEGRSNRAGSKTATSSSVTNFIKRITTTKQQGSTSVPVTTEGATERNNSS